MKVEQSLRGGKKGAPRSRRRGQRKTFQKTDLMVTLPNEESKESRLKPPVSSTQQRKIVRISQNKTESTDLEKVTVKSLEEIKREKELRKESAVLSRLSIPSLHDPASQIANGSAADSAENDVNGSKPTSSASVPGSSTAKPKLRDFSIPLKPLPAQSSANCKILHAKSQVATVSSLSQVEEHEMETREVRMDFDSKLAEQDFDYVDDEEESDSVEDYDEDFLLKEDEEIEMEGDSSLKQSLNSNFSSYTSDEPEDDEISLHPDDSMFDEEDEPRSSNSRTLGRRSGSQSKDLRSQITDRQKGNSTKMINITVGEPEGNEVKDERQGMSESSEQDESLLKRSENRERDSRNSSHKRLSRERDNRHGPRDSRHFVDRRKGRARFRGSVPMRGKGSHGSRQAPRKGNVPNVFPNTIPPLPSLLGHGGGLLPLPSPANMGLVSQIQRALEANIVNNLKTQVEMLTNPPPVPGEIITNFDQSKKHTSVLRGAQNVPNDFRNSGRHSARRTHNTQPKPSSVSKQSSISTVTQPAQVSSQQNDNKGRDIPKWLQKTYEQGQESQANAARGFTSTKDEQNTAVSPRSKNTATAKESFEYGHSSRPIIDSTLTHCSPHSDSNAEMQLSSNKRRSPFHAEEVPHGGKIVVATSPEGIPQPRMQNRSPKQLYPEQFQTGSYLSKPWHLPKQELEEHQKLRQLGHVNSQDHLAVVEPASVQQIKVDIPDVSYDLVNELLQNGNLGAAWQMIEKLRSMNHPPDLSVLQHVLTLCSKHLQDPDVAAQVAHNAFDMIGGMVVHHNRHNYETLIKTLCHSGQYIRAYEMLEVMKKDSHAPTYDVFLDLVQASVKDPEWAFSLLDEIKQSGVFRSKICSDLILLGCKSGEFFIERTWLLFQEALKNQVQVTAGAISAILFTLAQANEWDKIMSVLLAVSEALPGEILKSAVLMATQKIDWIEAVIAVLAMTPAEKGLVLDEDVWNTFLSNCCTDHGNNISFAQRVYSLMQQNEIPLSPMSVNNYMRALSHCGNWMAALELFTAVHKDPQVVQQAQALKSGLIALSSALQKAAASSGMLNVVHFMMVHHIKPEDSVLQSAVEYLDNEKNYKGVQEFFKQLQDNAIVAPLVVYKEIVSSLEKWIEDPEASTEPYTAMRRAYPSGQSYAANKNEASSDSVKNEAPRKVCKYIGTPKGCFSGVNCKFLHPEGSMPVHEGSQQTAPQSVKPVPAATLQTLQQNTNSSAGNVPVINAAAESEMSPFMLQSTSVNPLPFTINLGSVQGTSTEQSHCSMKSQKQSQATQLCKFFNTHQWCRWGDNCRFIHHTSSVAMEADSNTVVPELPPVRSTEARVSKNHTGNPFVLRSLSSTSTFASENRLFGFANNWQPPSSGFQPAAPVTPTVHSAAAKPVTASNHFQLVDGSQLVGKNPFSPNFPGRTQSLDGLSEHKATEHNQQAHSAPVVPERPGISHFRFPSKKSIEFYLPRIQFASQQNSWEDLGYVYVSMKKEAVEINNSVIECFYQSFQTFCAADTIGQSFQTFAERIERNLKETMAELDKVDKEFIGQIGVALMYFCYRSKHFIQGRQILYLLHKLGIDYYLYSGEFGLQQRPLTATEVVLTAVDICLNLEKPAYDDALVVLQSTNLALSYYERETVLTTEEADWKRRVFLCLCKKFMDDKQLHIVKELLSQVGNIDVFGRDVVNVLYNELVVALINNNEPHVTTEVVKIMGANSILVEPETTRALVRGFGAAGFGAQARQHFSNGCDAGVYPDSFKIDDPWTVVIGTSFSAVESQLYIARHLDLLYLHIEKLACASGDAVLDDKYYRPLKVVIESDEEQTVVNKFMRGDEIIRCVREMLCTVLANDFNPPLACHPKMRDEEVIVDAMSLKRWFRANPASGRSRRGDRLLSPPRAHTSGSNPYLLPGMTNVVPTDDQRGDRRVFVVSEADSLAPGKTIVPEEVQPATFLSRRGQPLTRKVSGRGHLKITKTT